MKIRGKLTTPILIALIAFFMALHFYWAPKQLTYAYETFISQMHRSLVAMDDDIVRNLLTRDYSALYSSMDAQAKNNSSNWINLSLYNENNKRIYPLFAEKNLPERHEFIVDYRHDLVLEGEFLGYINVHLDWRNQYKNENDRIAELEILLVAITFLLLAFILFWQNKVIIIPISDLQEASEKMADGDYDTPLPVITKDEVGQLTNAFRKMARDIKDRTNEIIIHRDNLHAQTVTLKVAVEKADTANREKSRFLASMSHELRTPMNSIIGFTGLVIKKSGDVLPEQQLNNLHTVDRNSRHLLKLINDLLDISKIESGRMDVFAEKFDLETLVKDVITLSQPLAEDKKLTFTAEFPSKPVNLYSDSQKVRHILINLLSNAIKFTDKGGIELKVHPPEKLNGQEYWLNISVTDTGIGISPEQKPYIFEAFRQVDGSSTRRFGGTGLGLTISQRLAKLLNGKLNLESQVDIGSTFTLSIPLNFINAGSMKQDLLSAEDISGDDGPLILCVDDDRESIELLRDTLVDEGYQVVGALSADNGFAKAKTLNPSLITLDILMPEKDGWQLLKELKQDSETRDIPVIMISMVENQEWGYQIGVADYLLKPVADKTLIDSISRFFSPTTILIVDDEPDVVDLLTQYFTDNKQKVVSVSNGKQALERIAVQQPDLILLDLLMPVMDGFEFLDELNKNSLYKDIPIIILTAKLLSSEEEAELKNRVEAVILKNGSFTDHLMKLISEQIRQLLARKYENHTRH